MDSPRHKVKHPQLVMLACLICLVSVACGAVPLGEAPVRPTTEESLASDAGARQTLSSSTPSEPLSVDARKEFEKGIALYTDGQFDEAINQFTSVLEQDPSNLNARSNLGASYFRKGELAAALHEFELAHSQAPDDAEILHNLGAVKLTMGDTQSALKDFKTAEQMSPDLADIHVGLGNLYLVLGEEQEGVRELRTALELAPDASWRPIVEKQIRDAMSEDW